MLNVDFFNRPKSTIEKSRSPRLEIESVFVLILTHMTAYCNFMDIAGWKIEIFK